MPIETELKLIVSPAGLAALARHPRVTPPGAPPLAALPLETIYYDSRDGILARAGLALRLRRTGSDSLIVSVKGLDGAGRGGPSGAGPDSGLSARPEWDVPCPADIPADSAHWPDLLADLLPGLLPDPGPGAAIVARLDGQPLVPLFTTRITRAIRLIEETDATIELALDEGTIEAGSARLPLCEVELELKAGSPRALFDLALDLADSVPLLPGSRSKAALGYRLALAAGTLRPPPGATDPAPPAPRPAPLHGDLTAAQAIRSLGRASLARLRETQTWIAGTEPGGDGAAGATPTPAAGSTTDPTADPTTDPATDPALGVHQMRVALRRLRSLITLFRPLLGDDETRALVAELRWLMGVLGPARDAEVFATQGLAPLAPRLASEPGWPALLALVEADRTALTTAAAEAVQSPRFARLLIAGHRWLEAGAWTDDPARADLRQRPLQDWARKGLRRRARAIDRAGQGFDRQTAAERHALRVRVKKLRYTLEALTDLYPAKATGRTLAAARAAQDTLGWANDAAVARDRLRTAARRLAATTPDGAFAAGLAAGLMDTDAARLETTSRTAWQDWRATKAVWDP